MNTTSPTIYKVYNTEKAATNWIARNLPNDNGVKVEKINDLYFVIAR